MIKSWYATLFFLSVYLNNFLLNHSLQVMQNYKQENNCYFFLSNSELASVGAIVCGVVGMGVFGKPHSLPPQ